MPSDTSHTYAALAASPVGVLGIRVHAGELVAIDIEPPQRTPQAPTSAAAREVLDQLFRYFDDPHWRFELPLAPQGTPFQCLVWRRLRGIPAGATRTYGELATDLGSSARAIGGACRRNPIPIVVPCHRVVAASGLGGFMGRLDGAALDMKEWLLAHEGRG